MKNYQTLTLRKNKITDFSEERNSILKKTKAKWLFFVDSDEVVSNELKHELEVVTYSNNKINGYYVMRNNYFLGKYIGRDKILRLAKNYSGLWKRAVHEYWDVKGKTGVLKNFIVHNTADNLNGYINKINKYSVLHAKANKKEGKKGNIFKVIFYPFIKFWYEYLKSGSIVFGIMQSFHSFLAWSLLCLQKN